MEEVKFSNLDKISYAMRESLRALKTNIQFCGDDKKVILFTSAVPDEGKSTVVFNLARSMTESGKRVLIIDADIRKSVFIGRLKAKTENKKKLVGLSHYLSGQMNPDDVLYTTNVENLYMIFAGPSVPNPTELLERDSFKLLIAAARDQFDYVLIDCPPLGAAIDAAVVAHFCDGAIIVIQQTFTGRRLISAVKKQLDMTGVKILGAVVNKVQNSQSALFTYYSGKYGSYYGKYYGRY